MCDISSYYSIRVLLENKKKQISDYSGINNILLHFKLTNFTYLCHKVCWEDLRFNSLVITLSGWAEEIRRMNKKKTKPMTEIKFLGCSHTKNAITATVVKTTTWHESLKDIVKFWNWFEGLLTVMNLFAQILKMVS